MEFRRGLSDAMMVIRSSRQCVGILDEEEDNPRKIYDEKAVTFSAEREAYDKPSKPLPPNLFTARLDVVTQINTLPASLLRYFDDETIARFEDTEPGDLNTIQSIEYTVQRASEDVDITRNMSYTLREDEDIMYMISETDETDKYERVPLAHEKHTLLVARKVKEESVADAADQVQYNALFDSIFFDAKAHSDFYPEFLAARDTEAAIAILGMIKSLKTGSKIPTIT